MKPEEILQKYNIEIESKFVPFSRSRNKHEKDPSLNWKVTLKHNGKEILTTDYMAGLGHCPSYVQKLRGYTMSEWEAITKECEQGFVVKQTGIGAIHQKSKPILPDSCNVVYSLLSDSDVLNYSSFEDWAGDFGYDEDSRKAESIYNDCMKIALKLRNGLGDSLLEELQEAFQEY